MTDQSFDLAVIGGGPGGYVSAIRAGQLNLKTVLIEKAELGGVCLNRGCIPTKVIIKNAEVLSLVKNAGKFGIKIDNYSADYSQAVKRAGVVVKRLGKGIEFLLKKAGVEIVEGEGILASKDRIVVRLNNGEKEIKAKNIIISTGSRPMIPDGIKTDGKNILTSNDAICLPELPKDMVIVGGGAIGVEFAYIFSVYGVDVTVVESMPRILPGSDTDVAEGLARSLVRRGIKIITNATLKSIKEAGRLSVNLEINGNKKSLETDKALVAIGRRPNSENLGLKDINMEMEKGVFIKTNDKMQTSLPGIYAIGDIASPPLLAHKAMAEGILAVETMAGKETYPIDRLSIPLCIYTEPQTASVGLTEEKAREEGYRIRVSAFSFRASGKALAMGDGEGFVKVIADDRTEKILGVHMLGHDVTELIGEAALARLLESTAVKLNRTIHPHPTLSEALAEAAGGIFGAAIHT